jgi:hypothetical protein
MSSEHHAHSGPDFATPADACADGLRVDPDFFVDFHPARAHEIHLPGGDPTTEIFS